MSLATLLVHEVSIVRAASLTDGYGDTLPDWSTATRTSSRARIVYRTSSEELGERDARLSEWVGYFPTGTDIVATDRVEWDDRTFEVVGPPNPAPARSSTAHHVEANLSEVLG